MRHHLSTAVVLLFAAQASAGVGDPQLATDHPWYPGELACSTFDHLFATQAAVFRRVVGREPAGDEDKALASWLWRSTHYWHSEEGAEDWWDRGFTRGGDTRGREYWTGLFSHGFGLCGTTHSQWAAEFHYLLGPHRGRAVGAAGHNTFEAFLTGGPYRAGRWALLDHDLGTVVFDPSGQRLLSATEVSADWRRLTDRRFRPDRQHGWPVCGLDQSDAASYRQITSADYGPGYAGPPPMVHLRRGESFRRYFAPGLEDGKTFVFWGRNSKFGPIAGPARNLTWVNRPDRFYPTAGDPDFGGEPARYANAVFTYIPDFADGSNREGVFAEGPDQVVFEHNSPYIIAATPPNDTPWGIYDAGGTGGLIVSGKVVCTVAVSVDRGRTWADGGRLPGRLDLTDRVKGHRQYRLKLGAGPAALRESGLTIQTVCQANAAVFPRLTDGGTAVQFAASGRAVVSAGPTLTEAQAHRVAGNFGSPDVTLELATPHGEPAVAVYAAAHVQCGNPPSPDVKYQIDYSADGGATWRPVVRDWSVPRRGEEPADFWSQTLVWGSADLPDLRGPVRVRFRNDGRKPVLRAEAHLVYRPAGSDITAVTFAWADDAGSHRDTHAIPAGSTAAEWRVPTGHAVRTQWVEMRVP